MKFLYFEKLETNKLIKQVFRIKTNCHHHLAVAIKSHSTDGVSPPSLVTLSPHKSFSPLCLVENTRHPFMEKGGLSFFFKNKNQNGLLFFSSYIKKCIQHHLRVNHTRKKHVKHSLHFFFEFFFPILCA